MRVFEIKGDVNKFQSLLPRDAKVLQALADGPLWFDGRPRKSEWVPPEMMIMSPKLKAPDIWDVNQGAGFAATDRALPLILEFFEMAGEILPLPIKGQTLHLLNVTVCEDCLDGDKCRWILGDDGERIAVKDDHICITSNQRAGDLAAQDPRSSGDQNGAIGKIIICLKLFKVH